MRHFALIVGASRGYGRAVSIQYAKQFPRTDFYLLGRTVGGLEETAELLKKESNGAMIINLYLIFETDCTAKCFTVDLSDLANLDHNLTTIFSQVEVSKYSQALLLNNSGSMGETKAVKDLTDIKLLQNTIDMNVTSCIWLTSLFLKKISSGIAFTFIVNVSSGAAVTQYETWSEYCSAKAARNMFHAVLAKEEDPAKVKVLNWAPGVMHTAMQDEIQEKGADAPVKQFLANVMKQGFATKLEESAEELVKVLVENTFNSGEHVDIYTRRTDLLNRLLGKATE